LSHEPGAGQHDPAQARSICPRSAAAIEEILHEAGVPRDVYVNTFASSRQIPSVLADDRIVGVS